ncbi:MAG: heavy metal translocating P-type ATPase, partial [Anaerolineales bacterium]|nr:heavy metal translocating P-type ATPase [Anaerolineales bacterium]
MSWNLFTIVLFAAGILIGGYPIAKRAWQEVRYSRIMGINALMVLAVIGAAAIGEWAEAAIVVVLFSLGEAMESFAADRARGALDCLLDLAPPAALKYMPDGELCQTGVELLEVGDIVLIRPGDRVSVDGVIQSGHSSVDQSPITGESAPAAKAPGDDVYAGSVNGEGALTVEVTRLAVDNTLNRMIALVQQARSRQAPIQRFIDRFARIYTPTVAVAAFLAAAIPPLLFGEVFLGEHGWLMRSLQMLVIACPCALVISTPVSIVSAMTNAASRGVLIKGGRYLDALGRIRVLAFDKTGTLTQGKPTATDVLDICTCGNCAQDCGLQHAAALEAHSSHPLAMAVLSEARARKLSLAPASDVTVLSGQGLKGTVNGYPVTVANHAHFDRYHPHAPDVCQKANELAEQGKTVVMVQHDNLVCGLLAFTDTLRPESKSVIEAVKAMGIRTLMLTGDNRTVAESIGRQAGINQVEAELLPGEKMDKVAALSNDYGMVAMVGDGI